MQFVKFRWQNSLTLHHQEDLNCTADWSHLDHSEKGSVDGIAAWAGQEICLTLHYAVNDAPRAALSLKLQCEKRHMINHLVCGEQRNSLCGYN